MGEDFSKLKRLRYPMPDFVRQALDDRDLMETKEKRLRQMLEELERGGVYMKMKHPASA